MAKTPTEQIRDLVSDLKVLTERDENCRREFDKLLTKSESLQAELAIERQERVAIKQQLADQRQASRGAGQSPVDVDFGSIRCGLVACHRLVNALAKK